MGGFDDNHGGIIGDWMPPSPSPRTLFAAMLGDDMGPRAVSDNDNGFTFPGPDRQIGSEVGQTDDQVMKMGDSGEQKTGARGGLVERMAARAGHNAPRLNTDIMKPVDSSANQQTKPPFLFSPGFSPTSFLDSPVFLSNSLVQPSPTTGKFQFGLHGNNNNNDNSKSSMMYSDSTSRSKDNFFEEPNNSSFVFKPFTDSVPLPRDQVNAPFMPTQSFQTNGNFVQPEKQFPPQKIDPTQDYSDFSTENKNFSQSQQQQQHHEEQHNADENRDQRINGDNNNNSNNGSSDDGYNWRKYGQKQVRGSEYPRSYYKCTHPNCPVKKKVERSHEGHITEIIYKGAHNHPKVGLNKRSGIGSSSVGNDTQNDGNGNENGDIWGANMQNKGGNQWGQGQDSNFEVNSSGVVMQGQNGQFESSDAVDGSTTFSNDEEEDDRVTHGSVSLGYDGEGDESESKRRKVEAYAADVSGATRAIREPRVVVQTTSEVDILDDGYRWRKYGQKVVKGNPNPRSYYKCTSTGCTVRKHVERASHDLKSVITTYEGKHNHDVPAARNTSHSNNHQQQTGHLAEPSRMQPDMARFDRQPYGLHNGQPFGPIPTHGYGYSMNQQGPNGLGLAHMAMTANHSVHHYLNQQRQMMVPKGEPKVEPVSDTGLNLANGAPVYNQMMNRLM